ncbi:MAG: Iron hydrogenase 1 [Syntrophaceae bacterium PtaU1.Bin231]|nr:MAG: Iron hydrogenase 1 [Syntrophaceae bacterium PtaU1.Bin231]
MNEVIIITNPERCRDCYRCVRSCELKAIRVKDGHVQVVPELCITCGICVRVCPQKAKDVRSTATLEIKQARLEGKRLIASVAPSAPAYFGFSHFSEMESVLKSLGFHAAEETAVGAEIVGLAHREYMEQRLERGPVITSSCPVVVNLIEQYNPDLIPYLAPIVSPMIAHGRLLAQKYGPDAYIVFIGPCLAKKREIFDEPVAGVIHAALTFRGLQAWLQEEGITWPEKGGIQEEPQEEAVARLFPIEGGLIGTARMSTDVLNNSVVITTGLEACQDVLNEIRAGQLRGVQLVELMACKGGCINGPVMEDVPGGMFLARKKVMDYQAYRQPFPSIPREQWPVLARTYADKKIVLPEFSEEQIQEVLHRVNKYSPEDELNCGACGYSSCREKAIAVLRGMAEVTMCVPYMRNRSESLRQVVMDVSPNAIVIIDDRLTIQDMSPSAEQLFKCSLQDIKGKPLSDMVAEVRDFISVRDTGSSAIARVARLRDDIVVEQSIVRIEGQPLLVAMMRDITEQDRERKRFETLREKTLEQTREVVRKQMRVAHEIAHLLGETTAESKMIISHLTKLLEEE